MSDPNISDDAWGDQDADWSGGGATSKQLVPRGPMLGATLYELGPGNFMIFHFHHGSEELLVTLRGRPTLRTFDGERELEEGAVVHFPAGPEGAHEIRNDTDEPVRYLVAGMRVTPEVVEYPELQKLTAQSRLPSKTGGEPLFVIHDVSEQEHP